MGYYADVDGYIQFYNPLTNERKEKLIDLLERSWYECTIADDNMSVSFFSGEKYYYETDTMLNTIAENFSIKTGSVECHGEDGANWRFQYVNGTPHGTFVEYTGRVVYDDEVPVGENDTGEFIGQIIDVFEDFLDEKGIVIPNEDKEQSGEDAANIYGMDYGMIQSQIEGIMRRWNIIR